MFVLNLKLSVKKIIIACLSISLISAMAIEYVANKKIESTEVLSNDSKYDFNFTDDNFLELLKSIHENIAESQGKTVRITGFVFKMPDFDENTFVCGRNIVFNNEDSIAGIMCTSENAKNLVANEWVQITGTIYEGKYITDMPVIRVESIKKVQAPANTFIS